MLPDDMVATFRRLAPGIVLPLYDRLSGRRIREEWLSLRRLQWRSSEELEDRAGAELKGLLIHASAHVPFYRDQFADAGADPGKVTRAAGVGRGVRSACSRPLRHSGRSSHIRGVTWGNSNQA